MKKFLLQRMKTVMTVLFAVLLALPLAAGNYVKINGVEKQLYGHRVSRIVGDDNSFDIEIFLSPDHKEYLAFGGNNDLHANSYNTTTYCGKYEQEHEGQTYWIIKYNKDGYRAILSSGKRALGSSLFDSGSLKILGGNPYSGRFGLRFNGKITDTVYGDGNQYSIEAEYRTEWEKPTAGEYSIAKVTNNTITLTLKPAVDNDTPMKDLKYKAEWKKEGAFGWKMDSLRSLTSSYPISGLEPSTTYIIDVLVQDACGNYVRYGEKKVTTNAEKYPLWIAGTQVTSDNCGDLSFIDKVVSGNIRYDPKTTTLHLNATIFYTEDGTAIISEQPLNIVYSGLVSIKSENGAALNLGQNTTIRGKGTLKLLSTKACAIYMEKDLTIDSCNVFARGSWGIAGDDGTTENLRIRASTVRAIGNGEASIADIRSLTLLGCEISYPEGAAFDPSAKGVTVDGELTKSEVGIYPVSILSDLVLTSTKDVYSNKANVIRIIRSITGLPLLECLNLYNNTPCIIKEKMSRLEADEAAEKLRNYMAEVEVHPHGTWTPDGIEDVTATTDKEGKSIYSLSGKSLDSKLESLPSGIYIVNGKKVHK